MSDKSIVEFFYVTGQSTIVDTLTVAEEYLDSLISDAIVTTGYVSHSVSSVGVPRSTWTLEYSESESPWKMFRAIFKRKQPGGSDYVLIKSVFIIIQLPEVPV